MSVLVECCCEFKRLEVTQNTTGGKIPLQDWSNTSRVFPELKIKTLLRALLLRPCLLRAETQETIRQSFLLACSAFYRFLLRVFTDLLVFSGFFQGLRLNGGGESCFHQAAQWLSLSILIREHLCLLFSAVEPKFSVYFIQILYLPRVHLAACSYGERQVSRS